MDESIFEGLDGNEARELRMALELSMQESPGAAKPPSPARVVAPASKKPVSKPQVIKQPIFIPSSSPEPEVQSFTARKQPVPSAPMAPKPAPMSALEQLRATAERRKRPAEENADEPQASTSAKPYTYEPPKKKMMGMSDLASRSGSTSAHSDAAKMKFPKGAIRLTRTPGRNGTTPGAHRGNTITFEELVDPNRMRSGIFYAFFIAQDELFDRLKPFKVPTYIGRDACQDLARAEYMDETGEEVGDLKKAKKPDFEKYVKWAKKHYPRVYGKNFVPFYAPKISGSAHSKIMLIEYEDFCRIVMTSCNFMDCDFRNSDNLWYIQDFPRVPAASRKGKGKDPEQVVRFFEHFGELRCPEEAIDRFNEGQFDFSVLKAQFCFSRPGTSPRGADSFAFGALRLLTVAKKILKKIDKLPLILLEINTASLGQLDEKWVHGFHQDATGGREYSQDDEDVPNVRIIYPTRQGVEASTFGRDPACNMGSHIKWADASTALKGLLYHYSSTDTGMMFHNKMMLALNADAPDDTPFYLYLGSANFSNSAWGKVHADIKKTEKCSNFEAGVIIKGSDIEEMLAPEARDWRDIVPYDRPARAYNLKNKAEKPWNSDVWVKNK